MCTVRQLQRWIRKQQTQGQRRGESISGRRSVPGDTRVSRSSEHFMSGYGYDDSLHASPAFTLADGPESRRSAQEKMYAQMMKDEFNEYNMLASESAVMTASGGGTPRGKSAQGRGRGGATPSFTVGGDRGGRAIHGRQPQQQQRGGRQIRAQKVGLRSRLLLLVRVEATTFRLDFYVLVAKGPRYFTENLSLHLSETSD